MSAKRKAARPRGRSGAGVRAEEAVGRDAQEAAGTGRPTTPAAGTGCLASEGGMPVPPVFAVAETPLEPGVTLIEASAGTGKTFTIAGLFLRLLLERGLDVRQILVVTYTKAATAELRDRVRRRLAEARRALELAGVASGAAATAMSDPVLRALLGAPSSSPAWGVRGSKAAEDGGAPVQRRGVPAGNKEEDEVAGGGAAAAIGGIPSDVTGLRREFIQRLDLALQNFDEAPIHTIHSFCGRVLHDRAFESGSLFDEELQPDPATLVGEVLADFWRQRLYPAGALVTAVALSARAGPEAFRELTTLALRHPNLRLYSAAAGRALAELGAELDALAKPLRAVWRAEAAAIRAHFGSGAKWTLKPYNRDAGMAERFRRVEAALGEASRWTPAAVEALHDCATSALAKRASAKGTPPAHEFFDLCEALRSAAAVFAQALDREAVEFARAEVPRRLAERKLQSFDALLTRLRDALAGPAGARLTRELRGQFAAALIDEFQDTDPVQYEIFRRLFATPGHFLFLIGDPKQAIYGFRGADVFTYLRAAGDAQRRFTLSANWRSEAALVRATNTLFSGGKGGRAEAAGGPPRAAKSAESTHGPSTAAHPAPFVFPRIVFQPVEPRGAADQTPFTLDGQAPPPLEIWFAAHGEDGKVLTKGHAERELLRVTAAEIHRLVRGAARLGARPLREEDVAVLVPENRQAAAMQEALRAWGLPSVLQTTGSVLESPECEDLRRILAALAEPGRHDIVRAALATDLLGCSGQQLATLAADDAAWQRRLDAFRAHADTWAAEGFIVMFRRWLHAEGVRARLLAFPDGERRLTNVLHLGELLHAACAGRPLDADGLLKWLADRRAERGVPPDETQLRLETDERAVKLVTVHRSKGLEYPVVFVPFAWAGAEKSSHQKNALPQPFHDDTVPGLALDLGSAEQAAHGRLAVRDRLAELVRLFYVAVTRARHRCVWVWGSIRGADSSAPAWLLHAPEASGEDPVATLQDRFAALGDADLRRRLDELVEFSADECGRPTIAVRPLPDAAVTPAQPAGAAPAPGTDAGGAKPPAARRFTASITRDWRVTSFSALTARAHEEQPDYDAWVSAGPADEPASGIFAFPRGAAAGTCLHKILERLDFAEDSDPGELVREELRAAGLSESWAEEVGELLRRVVAVPLDGPGGHLRLAGLRAEHRRNELEFCFPLARITAAGLGAVLGQPELAFEPVRGLLKGYVDLVFERDGRFHLVDWKSNWLGGRVEDYHAAALAAEMTRQHYDLQALLYTVALDRYLRLRLPGYDYDRHFGGVFYVFLRGLDPVRSEFGVHRLRPERPRMDSLAGFLTEVGRTVAAR